MGAEEKAPGIDEILDFYDERGYRYSVGAGERPAIVVIDFSNIFTQGRTGFPGGDFAEEICQTRRMLEAARTRRVPIFYTTIAYRDPERDAGLWGKKVPWLVHCRAGSQAVEIDAALERRSDEEVIVKKFPSAFFGTDLDAQLGARGVDTVVLAGCTTSVCVRATAIDAMQHGYRTLVAAEAVGEFNPSLHAVHLRDMGARYADVVSVEATLGYLRGLNSDWEHRGGPARNT